ncbi:hypothetical protein IMCC3317_15550 [Kordia antarctica]|uniref:Outer membrane protein beta-barrel domain-containing protein n=1 Tax=Kordia antarctica TaxID=1218801 RepID=A0A7L4ZJ29_9FLAO|nr:hypothetical protein [Kordia antarctica]QHI36196.1 hypothetical protein IMCC3317_15550 [Kordia antarctica]
MKSLLFSFFGLFCVVFMSAQEAEKNPFEEKLKEKQELVYNLIDEKEKFDRETAILKAELEKLTDEQEIKKATTELESRKKTAKEKQEEIVNVCSDYTKYRGYLEEYENITAEVLTKYKARICEIYKEATPEVDPTKFIIIGENDPIKAEDLLDNENTKKVLADVFSIDSKTNLGTFEIPGENSFITFYSEKVKRGKNKIIFQKAVKNPTVYIDNNSYALPIEQLIIYEKNRANQSEISNNKKDSTKVAPNNESNTNKISKTEPPVMQPFPKGALFKSIQIEIHEGGIVDTRLILESVDHKTHFYFEGRSPVSILNYTRRVSRGSFLEYSHYVSLDGITIYNEEILSQLLVKYTDVLDYHPNAGSNYVPDDISYKFPTDETKEASAERRTYEVINNNHLQHVLDLRTYTDMLGLFGDEANGLFQIEGKADFFIIPFNIQRSSIYLLKKVSPFVRYSRFDDDEDFINTTLNTGTSTYEFDNKKLGLLERSTLEMGMEIDIFNCRFVKESPFWISLYTPLTYNVTRIQADPTKEKVNFKTLGYGLGAEIELKRFNNFGLTLGYELKGYSFLGDYSEEKIREPSYLKTQTVKAEIFYFPGSDRSQSIFLRMKSIRDVSSGNADSFFQLQIGYRFTIGVGAVKAK